MKFLKIKQKRKTAIRGDRKNDILNSTKNVGISHRQRKHNI